MIRKSGLLAVFLWLQAISASSTYDIPKANIITTDVAIIGGGASGTYAAVRLREDLNTSIVLIETRSRLGGHVSTYLVPETNTTLEYGVQSYMNYGGAKAFFTRFGITTQPFASKRNTAINVNVETGDLLKNYTAPSANATNEAFQRWLTIVSKYEEFLEPGYWKFPLPADIPSDFLVPFGVFAKQNQLEAAIPRILTISGTGTGGIADLLTFHMFQAFGAALTKDVVNNQLFAPVGSNSLLYQRALALLKSDVLLSSEVESVKRTPQGVELVVKQGKTKYLIQARRILYTAAPTLDNLYPFDIDAKEQAIFSKFSLNSEYIGVAKVPCIPENTTTVFLPETIVPANQLALKDWPYAVRLDSTGPTGLGLFRLVFGANSTFPVEDVETLVTWSVNKLKEAGTIAETCEPEYKVFSDHTRAHWRSSAEQLKSGFVQELYSLQGYRGVWYVGYLWSAPYSSTVWAFVDTLLPKLLADLKA